VRAPCQLHEEGVRTLTSIKHALTLKHSLFSQSVSMCDNYINNGCDREGNLISSCGGEALTPGGMFWYAMATPVSWYSQSGVDLQSTFYDKVLEQQCHRCTNYEAFGFK
jgi:hypothetical protein